MLAPMRHSLQTALILLLMTLTVHADTIYLKNGRSIDGIVIKEDDSEITLDLGVGSMRIKKSKIKNIGVADEEENTAIEDKWEREHILHKRHMPEGMEPLVTEFKALEAARSSVGRASRNADALRKNLQDIANDIIVLQENYLTISRELQWLKPKNDPGKYNATVAKNNAISAELKIKEAESVRIQKDLSASSKTMANYLNSLTAFDAKFRKASSDEDLLELGPSYTLFFEEIEKRMSSFRSEYKTHDIITASASGSTIVHVTINRSISATMILDTGATSVTISQALADKLKVNTDSAPMTRVVLADGTTLKARNITLTSIQAGSATAEGVEAIILPQPPAEGVDGLLGMSFLSRFRVKLDGSSRKLILEELDLKKE